MPQFKNLDPLKLTIADYLDRKSLTPRIQTLDDLNRSWIRAVGREWSSCSFALDLQGDTLRVGVRTPAQATRLRFTTRSLIQRLRSESLPTLKAIQFQVQPSLEPPRPQRGRTYSQQAATNLSRAAEQIEDDELRAALIRLAQHIQVPPSQEGSQG